VKCSVFSVQCSVALLGGVLAAGAQTNQPIDLPTALRLAGAQNLDVQIARERLREAEAQRDAAIYNFFPWVTPGVGYRRHDGRLQDVAGNIFNASKQSYTLGGTLTAQVELGEAYFKTLAAKQLAKAADHALAAQRQESVAAAALGYFDLARAQAGVGVARETLNIAEDYAGQLARAVEAGLAFKGDALRAQVQVARNVLALRSAEEQRQVNASRLAQLLRLEPATPLVARDADLAPISLAPTNAALDSLVARALAERPELKQTKSLTKAAKEAHEGVVKGPLVPTLGAQAFLGGLGGGRNGSLGQFGDTEDFFVGLSWRIGPGGLFDEPRRKAAAARVNVALLGEEKVRDDIIRQVVEAHSRLNSNRDQLEVARAALHAAEEALRLTRARKEFAVGAVLENIEAQRELARARQDVIGVAAEFNKAQYALQRAIGALAAEEKK